MEDGSGVTSDLANFENATPTMDGNDHSQVRVTISIPPVASSTSATVFFSEPTSSISSETVASTFLVEPTASQSSVSSSSIASTLSSSTAIAHASSAMATAASMVIPTVGTMMEMTAPSATAAAAEASATRRAHDGRHKKDHDGFIIKVVGVVVGVFVGLIILAVVLFILYRKYGRKTPENTVKGFWHLGSWNRAELFSPDNEAAAAASSSHVKGPLESMKEPQLGPGPIGIIEDRFQVTRPAPIRPVELPAQTDDYDDRFIRRPSELSTSKPTMSSGSVRSGLQNTIQSSRSTRDGFGAIPIMLSPPGGVVVREQTEPPGIQPMPHARLPLQTYI